MLIGVSDDNRKHLEYLSSLDCPAYIFIMLLVYPVLVFSSISNKKDMIEKEIFCWSRILNSKAFYKI